MPTIVCQCAASNQDCLIWKDLLGNWQFKLNDQDVTVGFHSPARRGQGAGLYFPLVPIPPGSTIHKAYLILRSSHDRIFGDVKSLIQVEDNPNPAPFTTLADYWARPRLSPHTLWLWDTYDKWFKDRLYASPDFSSSVQTIIDQPGWVEDNPLVIFWNDHDLKSQSSAEAERIAYSWDYKLIEAPRLEITYIPPTPPPPPPPPLPTPPPPPRKSWAPLDLQYEYLDDGFKLTFHTDVPCHLFCRMTTTPPRKHALPSYRRGLYLQGDIRFCFVVYEDNEQEEAGDTLIHTFLKPAWPICETRWFYFVGNIYGDTSPSESPIFKFHFPAPPPEPPPPILKVFFPQPSNRTIRSNSVGWGACWNGSSLEILPDWDPPDSRLISAAVLTASYWISRSFLTYNTTSIPATAKIVSATLAPWFISKYITSSFAYPYWQITPGHQSDPVVIGDWVDQNPETAVLGQIDIRDIILNEANDIPLNAEGLAHIGKSLPTLYCCRIELDVRNIPPPLGANAGWYHSFQKGGNYRPALAVFYYPA